jgi:hypothetical protein
MSGGYALTFIFFLSRGQQHCGLCALYSQGAGDGCDPHHPSPLTHWTFSEETVRASAEREFRNYNEQNRAMFILIGGMLVAAALFFIIFVQEGGLKTGILLLVVTAFLFVISRVVPGLERQRAIRAPHKALITKAGIMYEGSIYPFRSFLVYQNGISIHKADKKDPAMFIFPSPSLLAILSSGHSIL